MIRKIITNLHELRKVVNPGKYSQEEIDSVSLDLINTLTEFSGVGLTANQIGLDKRICLINVNDPLILVNPVIQDASKDMLMYAEGCLSIPKTSKKSLITKRHFSVKVKADNFPDVLEFGPTNTVDELSNNRELLFSDTGLLESIAVQHEIDHLNGITIIDRMFYKPMTSQKEYGRNEKVMIENPDTGESEFIKYKKIDAYIEQGWVIK